MKIYVVYKNTFPNEPIKAFNDRESAYKYANEHENYSVAFIPYEEIFKHVENF